MKRMLLLVVLGMLVAGSFGCRSIQQDAQYTVDDTVRFVGLDQPTNLHPRNMVPSDYYSPYR